MPVGPRKVGGPNTAFLRQYGLDEKSHPMDWFTAFMPFTPDANLVDPAIANVKGDRMTKFAVSNWTAYSNTKAMLNNAGEEGHIFAGKHRPFTNKDIVAMLGVYVGTQTRKLPIPLRGSAIPVLVPVLVQAAPYSIIH